MQNRIIGVRVAIIDELSHHKVDGNNNRLSQLATMYIVLQKKKKTN